MGLVLCGTAGLACICCGQLKGELDSEWLKALLLQG